MSCHSSHPSLSHHVIVGLFFFLLLKGACVANSLVDLSQPWTLAANYNQNALFCTLQAVMDDSVVGYLVIQDGAIVAEGYSAGNIASDLNPAYSATKSWSSMIVGLLVDAGELQVNTTLGQVFADDSVWVDIVDAEEKKTLTVHELLTFTSGLSEIVDVSDAMTEQELNVTLTRQDTLTGVLNATSFSAEQRGTYGYLKTNHILARVIHQVSGKTPLEVATTESGAFAALGLEGDVDYTWDTFGGVEGSAFGLNINPRTLAKLGLLYLQQGYAAPDNPPIVSPAWVSSSTTNQLTPGARGYGYQWYVYDNGSFAAIGAGGQMLVVFPNQNIVVAVMTKIDLDTIEEGSMRSFQLVAAAASNFDAIDQDGSCVGDEFETVAPSSPPTSSGGDYNTEPGSDPTSGSAGLLFSKQCRFSLTLVLLLFGFSGMS